MNLIREKPSFNGILDYQVFEEVVVLKKLDSYFSKNLRCSKPTLWIQHRKGAYPLMFPTMDKRDRAQAAIESALSELTLDFNEYFTIQLFSDSKASKNMPKNKFTLTKHLRQCLNCIMFREKIGLDEIIKRDAFRLCSSKQLEDLVLDKQITFTRSQLIPELWSKCLFTPQTLVKRWGISPLQFQRLLIKNDEEHIICNSNSAVVDCV